MTDYDKKQAFSVKKQAFYVTHPATAGASGFAPERAGVNGKNAAPRIH